jgi:hypothetical protein
MVFRFTDRVMLTVRVGVVGAGQVTQYYAEFEVARLNPSQSTSTPHL